jgi:hypothetical protein
MNLGRTLRRHCEERSDVAIQSRPAACRAALDCFAPLAMTKGTGTAVNIIRFIPNA